MTDKRQKEMLAVANGFKLEFRYLNDDDGFAYFITSNKASALFAPGNELINAVERDFIRFVGLAEKLELTF